MNTSDAREGISLGEGVFIAVAAFIFLLSWFGLLLAEFGVFSLWALSVAIVASLSLLVLLAARTKLWPDSSLVSAVLVSTHRFELIGLAVLIAVAVFLYRQPFEYILGGLDSGVYVNSGVRIAREGSILIRDAPTAGFTSEQRELLFGRQFKPSALGNRFPGIFLLDLDTGIVEPHGFHLFPVWIAILYSVGGIALGLYATPLFGLLGVLAVYFLGRDLFGPAIGWLAAFLTSITVAQVWFSKFPMAETLVEFLLWTGLYGFVVMLRRDSRFFAILAGVGFGLVHFAKIDVVFLPMAFAVFFVAEAWLGRFRTVYWYFLSPYLLLSAHAVLHAVTSARSYTYDVYHDTVLNFFQPLLSTGKVLELRLPGGRVTLTIVGFILVIILAAVAGLLISSVRRRLSRDDSVLRAGKVILTTSFILALATAAFYGYFVRPTLVPAGAGLSAAETAYEVQNSSSLVRLGWYISPLALLLGIAGMAGAMLQGLDRRLMIVLLVTLPTTLLYLSRTFVAPLHFWAGRRFVYIVIPLFFLFVAYALLSFRNSRRTRSFSLGEGALPAALGAVLVVSLIQPNLPFLGHVEFKGAQRELARLASDFPRDGVVLFERSLAADRFAMPLQYIFERSVFEFSRELLVDPRLPTVLEKWRAENKRVFWAAVSNEGISLPQGYDLNHAGTETIVLPEAEVTENRLPSQVESYVSVIDIFEFVPVHNREQRTAFDIDLGAGSPANAGLHDADQLPGPGSVHWTTGDARLALPKWDFERPAELWMKVAANRPRALPVVEMKVLLDGEPLGEQMLTKEFRVYLFHIPGKRVHDGAPVLQLISDVWNPKALGISPDPRDLGVLVSWIKIVQ